MTHVLTHGLRLTHIGRTVPGMRRVAGVVLLLVLAGCSHGGGDNKTVDFAATVHSAYVRAVHAPPGGLAAASAWAGFANTVTRADAGDDTAQQGELVDAARQASQAYTAHDRAVRCQIASTVPDIIGNYPDASKCPDDTAQPRDYVAQIRTVMADL